MRSRTPFPSLKGYAIKFFFLLKKKIQKKANFADTQTHTFRAKNLGSPAVKHGPHRRRAEADADRAQLHCPGRAGGDEREAEERRGECAEREREPPAEAW